MYPRDWDLFLREGRLENPIAIAQLPPGLKAFLGGPSHFVYLRWDYAMKAHEKHGVPPEQFHLIFEAIDRGFAVPDKPRHVTFLYFDAVTTQRWFQVSVKCCEEDHVNVVATFHRQNEPEVRRRLKKAETILQHHNPPLKIERAA